MRKFVSFLISQVLWLWLVSVPSEFDFQLNNDMDTLNKQKKYIKK